MTKIWKYKCARFSHKLILFVFIIFFKSINGASAQPTNIVFQYYTTNDGLSQNMVDCILKDSKGFMWFGTWKGLNRFDGYGFEVYNYNPVDSTTVNNNFIHDLCEDKFGNIWVATDMGLNVYLYDLNRFGLIDHTLGKKCNTSLTINSLKSDKEGNIWIGWENGVSVIKPVDEKGHYIDISQQLDIQRLNGISVSCFIMDGNRSIWIGSNSGLYKYHIIQDSLEKIQGGTEAFPDMFNYSITSLFLEQKRFLWIGLNGNGVIRYDILKNSPAWYNFDPNDLSSLVHSTVESIDQDINGNIILGTLGGISIYNVHKDNFDNYTNNPEKKYSLNNNFVNCVYADSDGYVWVGTERGGVNKYNIYQKKFQSLSFKMDNQNRLSHNTINSVLDDTKFLWIGTAGGGLNRYNFKSGDLKIYRFNSHIETSLLSDFVTSIYKDERGQMWIGTWGGGIHLLKSINQENGIFQRYFNDAGNPNSIISDFISFIVGDDFGNLLIGTRGGLDVFTPSTGKFIHIRVPVQIEPLNEVGCLQFDTQGNLWVGTVHGLYLLEAGKNRKIDYHEPEVTFIHTNQNDINSISANYVISILLDQSDQLWFGTYGNGFNKLLGIENGKAKFQRFTENDGLSNNIVYGILDDNHGNLWLSTENGLSKFNIQNPGFKNYYESDGLISNQFYWSASYKNKKGVMYFGSMNGLNMFHPDSIHDNYIPPKLAFTGFKIYSNQVEVGKEYDGKMVLKKSIASAQVVVLSYRSKEFTIEFSALHYDQPEKNKYKYMLVNFDKNWNTVSSKKRYATYSNLDGGEYTFLLKGSNNDGLWSENPIELKITVVPPFWKSWWFRITLAVLIISGTFTYMRIRLYSLKKQKIWLEKKVVERTAKIEEQKEELQLLADNLLEANIQLEEQKSYVIAQNEEILEQRDKLIEMNKKVQSANQHRIHFFTNISHELRTPLTLILSPLEHLVERVDLRYEIKQKILLMYKNARRLLNLINQLMELRKVETGKLELKARKDDIVKFVTNISQSFQDLSFKRNLNFMVYSKPESLEMFFDHEKVEAIVYNLLSNAFKYTPEGGTVSLDISNKHLHRIEYEDFIPIVDRGSYKSGHYDEFIEIKVTDSGIGVEKIQIKEIFKMFYRDPSIEGTHVHGSGIGLSLVKELVKTHRGLLYVKSEKNKGSVFSVLLPTNEKYLLPEEKIEDNASLAIDIKYTHDNSKHLNKNKIISDVKLNDVTKRHLPMVMVVEDNPDMRAYICSELQNIFQTLEAVNGKEGIEMAKIHSPDFIISDIMMPEMDGLEMCAKIKSDIATSHIPVILLTSKSSVEDHIKGYDSGADDYIPKPFNTSLLQSRIQNILKNRENIKKLFSGRIIPEPKKITSNQVDEKFLKEAIKVVNESYHLPEFSVEKFASQMNMSRSLLHKKMVAIIGTSPIDFITSIRMNKAVNQLLNSTLNINEAAYKVGFNDPKYFSRCFKKQFNKTPTEFIKEHK
jgi:signal transduction histidine kinase/ligand-binding sensor domain-containing protein/DNA-binding response OmpR family regulator